jgi:acetyl-CoA carboxylase alpha subunit
MVICKEKIELALFREKLEPSKKSLQITFYNTHDPHFREVENLTKRYLNGNEIYSDLPTAETPASRHLTCPDTLDYIQNLFKDLRTPRGQKIQG